MKEEAEALVDPLEEDPCLEGMNLEEERSLVFEDRDHQLEEAFPLGFEVGKMA